MSDFDGRAVFITGAASGIGRATAQELLQRGAWVIAGDVQTAAETGAAVGASERLLALSLDVTDKDAVAAAIAAAVAWAGALYGVVNCAGINSRGALHEVAPQLWQRTLDVHLNGTFHVARAALPHLLAARRGAIVNVGSIYGLTGGSGNAAYNTAKGAILQLTRCMAADYGRAGIRVNAVSPGYIRTPLAALLDAVPQFRDQFIRMHPLQRAGEPEEVARAIVFLLSDAASFITGVNLPVDGGFVATHNVIV